MNVCMSREASFSGFGRSASIPGQVLGLFSQMQVEQSSEIWQRWGTSCSSVYGINFFLDFRYLKRMMY